MARELDYEIKEFDATSLSGSYQNFGSVTTHPVLVMSFYNTSDVEVYISKDGSTNNWRIPASGSLTIDSRDVKETKDQTKYCLDKGVQLEVKQVTAAGSDGDIIACLTLIKL